MITGAGRRDIGQDAMVADHAQFGISTRQEAIQIVRETCQRMRAAFPQIAPLLNDDLRALMAQRLASATQRGIER